MTASLIEWEDGRYRLHDLVRLFAGHRLEAGACRQAEQRHAVHYLEVLRRAGDSFEKGGEALIDGLKRFDLERVNIRTGQAWAAAHSTEEAETSALCSQYPSAGTYILALRLHPREEIRWREAALETARRQVDRGAEGSHLNNLGNAYLVLGEPRRAIEHHEQRLAIAREIGDRRGEGNALGNLGLAYADLGEPRRAIEHYEQALAIAREIGNRRGEANSSWNLGRIYEEEGDLERAADAMQIRVDYEREIGHPDAAKYAAYVADIRARIRPS